MSALYQLFLSMFKCSLLSQFLSHNSGPYFIGQSEQKILCLVLVLERIFTHSLTRPPPVVQYEFHYIWWDERESGGVVIFRENLLKPPSLIHLVITTSQHCERCVLIIALHHPPTLISRLSRILFPFWRMKEGCVYEELEYRFLQNVQSLWNWILIGL